MTLHPRAVFLAYGVNFPSGYHFYRFDGARAVGSYKQPNFDIFSVRHKLVRNRYKVGLIACCLCSWDLPSLGWSISARVNSWQANAGGFIKALYTQAVYLLTRDNFFRQDR